MRPIEGCDYAAGPIHPARLVEAGKRFVVRYLSTPGNPKNLTMDELAHLRLADLRVVLVFETEAQRALSGAAGGRADAREASQQAAALGLERAPIYFTVDFDAQPQQMILVREYIAAAAAELGKHRCGVYGGGNTLRACRHLVRYLWQAAAAAWGTPYPTPHLRQLGGEQIGGVQTDRDQALQRDYGQTPRPRHAVVWRTVDGFRVRVGSPLWRWLQRNHLVPA